jgi:hypothetical protein
MMFGEHRHLDRQQPEKYAHPYTARSRSWDEIVASYFVWGLLGVVLSAYLCGFMMDIRAPARHWPDYGYPIFGALFVGLIIIHEELHGIVARAFGMRVSFGVKWYGVAYTRYYSGRVARWQRATITLTPMILITGACFIIYRFTASNGVMALALIGLFSYTAASAIDLRNAISLLRTPYGTVFEIPDRESSMAIYEPQEHAVMASSDRTTRTSTLSAGELPRDPHGSLTREFDHWMSDLWIAASNRHLRSTGRAYGQLLWYRLSRWVLTQTPPSIQIHR